MSEKTSSDERLISEAREFLQYAESAEGTNRAEAMEDLRFRSGEQWPAPVQNSRQLEARPCLTINKVDAFIRQVTNSQRQQRPRIKVEATNNVADAKIAEIIQGMCRHIEVNSDADQAYDQGFDGAVTCGRGFWRVVTDYTSPQSFDQEIYIQQIPNPFNVFFDPSSVLPDGSDAERCLLTEMMSKRLFKKFYPDANDGANFRNASNGDETNGWITKEEIRVAEYFKVEHTKETLLLLSDRSTIWADRVTPELETKWAQDGTQVLNERKSFRRKIMWYKMTALEILEHREWPGRWIPIIPVEGNKVTVDGRIKRFGLVRYAKDPQRMYNYWRTAMTESVALAPKAKWLLAEGQDEGHEHEWATANVSAKAVLRYKQTDIDQRPAPPPQRLQPEPPPSGAMESAIAISEDLQTVLGVVDPAQKIQGNVSGKALLGERQQSDNSNFHYYDNLTRSIRHTGKIILDLIPFIYDTERVMRIIGDDGNPKLVTINGVDEVGQVVQNNVTIGEYDVVMDTGPGLNTKRQEAVEAMLPLVGQNEELFKIAGDLIFRNMDFPGAQIIADRLAAVNPLANIDEQSDIPPQAQLAIKQMQQQLQQAGMLVQSLQGELKTKMGIQQMREDAETAREHMRLTAQVHNKEQENIAWMHDIALKANTSLNVEELRGMVQLLVKKMDTKEFLRTAEGEESELGVGKPGV